MKIKQLLLFVVIVTLMFACYEDKGNYDYNDSVNDLKVIMNPVYGSRKEATTVIIKPTIEQTHYKGTDNLRYSWFVSNVSTNKGTETSIEDHITIEIDPNASGFQYNYYIRLYITDTLTGATQMYPTELRIAKPYEGAWMVLHEDNGAARLGSIEYIGNEVIANNDAYYSETGNRFNGIPYKLGVMNGYSSKFGNASICQFFIFTSIPEESGMYAQDKNFEQLADLKLLIPNDYSDFDVSKIDACCRVDGGGIMLSNGELFQASAYSARMGKTTLSDGVANDSPDYNITHATISAHINLAFDGLNNRFFSVSSRSNYWSGWTGNPAPFGKFEYIKKSPDNVQSISPDDIGADKQMLYLGPGYFVGRSITLAQFQRYAMYAFAISKNIQRSYVFEFRSRGMTNPGDANDPAPFSNYFVIDTPPGVTETTLMTSSWEYNRILFYAVDNRIYKLDFASSGGLSTLIYQHPNAEAKVSSFKIARGVADSRYSGELFPAARTLGAAFNMPDGSGEVVVLILNGAGTVEDGMYGDFPSIQRITESADGKKFGTIKDIAYI